MASKILNARLVQKNDTSENWAKATNFTPLKGEIIVYTDLGKIKIGDGSTKVGSLDFANAKDAETLMGASLSAVLNDSEAEIPTSKSVLDAINSIDIPTKTSDLTNDSGYLTEHQSLDNYYTKPEVDTFISDNEDTFIVEISDNKVTTPIAEYCAAFRVGKRVILDNFQSSWGVEYNYVMVSFSGNEGLEQSAQFSKVIPNYSYGEIVGIILCSAKVSNNGTITVKYTKANETDLSNYYTKTQVDVKIPTQLGQLTDNVGYVKTSDLDSVAFDGYVTKGKKTDTTVGANSTAEGLNTQATKKACHAEGNETQATGDYAHAEGAAAIASGTGSHAEGQGTYANGDYQHAQGKYNEKDIINKYANIVGNGTSDSKRSNAHTLDWDGNAWFAGKISVGTLLDVPNPLYANDLVTKKYVDNKFATKSVSLAADSWIGSESPYSQVVTLSDITSNSKVDLQPTPVQLANLADNETILNTANDNGIVTVYAIGNKPIEDYTMQATITEV